MVSPIGIVAVVRIIISRTIIGIERRVAIIDRWIEPSIITATIACPIIGIIPIGIIGIPGAIPGVITPPWITNFDRNYGMMMWMPVVIPIRWIIPRVIVVIIDDRRRTILGSWSKLCFGMFVDKNGIAFYDGIIFSRHLACGRRLRRTLHYRIRMYRSGSFMNVASIAIIISLISGELRIAADQ